MTVPEQAVSADANPDAVALGRPYHSPYPEQPHECADGGMWA